MITIQASTVNPRRTCYHRPQAQKTKSTPTYTYLHKGIPEATIPKKIGIPSTLRANGRASFLEYFDNTHVLRNIVYHRESTNTKFQAATRLTFEQLIREKRDFIESWRTAATKESALKTLNWLLDLPTLSALDTSQTATDLGYPIIAAEITPPHPRTSTTHHITPSTSAHRQTLGERRGLAQLIIPPRPITQTVTFTPSARPWKNGALLVEEQAQAQTKQEHHILSRHKLSIPTNDVSQFTNEKASTLTTLVTSGLPVAETRELFQDLFRYKDIDSRKVFKEFSKQTKNMTFERNEDGSYAFQEGAESMRGYAFLNIFIAILNDKTDPAERDQLGSLLATLIDHTNPAVSQEYDFDGDLPLHSFCKLGPVAK